MTHHRPPAKPTMKSNSDKKSGMKRTCGIGFSIYFHFPLLPVRASMHLHSFYGQFIDMLDVLFFRSRSFYVFPPTQILFFLILIEFSFSLKEFPPSFHLNPPSSTGRLNGSAAASQKPEMEIKKGREFNS